MLWSRVIILGFFDWLLPFVASLIIYPVLAYDKWLYANILALFHIPVVILMLGIYARSRPLPLWEAVTVVSIWVSMNVIIDQPIFVFGPFQFGFKDYVYQIAVTYLNEILFAFGAAKLYERRHLADSR